jgi:hypothetical protein
MLNNPGVIAAFNQFGIPYVNRDSINLYVYEAFTSQGSSCPDHSQFEDLPGKGANQCSTACVNSLTCIGFEHTANNGGMCSIRHRSSAIAAGTCTNGNVYYQRTRTLATTLGIYFNIQTTTPAPPGSTATPATAAPTPAPTSTPAPQEDCKVGHTVSWTPAQAAERAGTITSFSGGGAKAVIESSIEVPIAELKRNGIACPTGGGGAQNKVISGTCTLDAANCVLSPNYPSKYTDNTKCVLEMKGKITSADFHTEGGYDKLTVNDKAYSGQSVTFPSEDLVGQQIFQSDGSVVAKGFKICTSGGTLTNTHPANKVTSGPCTLDGACVLSPNYPAKYGSSQRCELEMHGYVAQPWTFALENGYDFLEVGGKKYTGNQGFAYADQIQGNVVFTSDYSVEGTGFKICTAATPSTSGRLYEETSEEEPVALKLPESLANMGMSAMVAIGAFLSVVLMLVVRFRVYRRSSGDVLDEQRGLVQVDNDMEQ